MEVDPRLALRDALPWVLEHMHLETGLLQRLLRDTQIAGRVGAGEVRLPGDAIQADAPVRLGAQRQVLLRVLDQRHRLVGDRRRDGAVRIAAHNGERLRAGDQRLARQRVQAQRGLQPVRLRSEHQAMLGFKNRPAPILAASDPATGCR